MLLVEHRCLHTPDVSFQNFENSHQCCEANVLNSAVDPNEISSSVPFFRNSGFVRMMNDCHFLFFVFEKFTFPGDT
jgi:hypothetical protein